MSFRFQFRRGTTAERNAANPVLAAGEPAVVLDSGQPAELVLGDGVTAMADLRAAVWDDDPRLTDARTPTAHPHAISGTTGLQAALDGKADKDSLAVNVKDFGATGDGITDDTAAIQAAINSLPLNTANTGILAPLGFANGGNVHIPRGRYKITSAITLRRGVHLYGDSREASQLVSFTAGSVLRYLDAGRYVQDEIVIENLSIWQDASVVPTSGAGIEVTFGTASVQSTNLIARNLIIEGTYRGILLGAGVWSSIDNCFLSRAATNGAEVTYTNGTSSAPTTSTTFRNCYASGCGGAGFHITNAAYISLLGCASDSNGTYGYHLIGGNTYTLMACGAEENTLGGAYMKNTAACLVNLSVVHTTAGTKHGISLEACDGTTLLGGTYDATTATGYAVNVVSGAGPITAIGSQFIGNYTTSICNSASKFLNLTQSQGIVGSAGNYAVGVDSIPDITTTFQVGGTPKGDIGLKVNPVYGTTAAVAVASQVQAQTAATAVTYPVLYGFRVLNPVKGAGSTVTRAAGAVVAEQTQGGTANANIFIDAGAAIPVGNWSIYSGSSRDSVFVGPIRSGSNTGPTWSSGTGSPEGVVTAPVGSLFSRTDGGAGTSLYVKQSGTGNAGWAAK